MSKTNRSILKAWVAGLLIIYGGCAFSMWSLNPFMWGVFVRIVFVVLTLVWSFAAAFEYREEEEKRKKVNQ